MSSDHHLTILTISISVAILHGATPPALGDRQDDSEEDHLISELVVNFHSAAANIFLFKYSKHGHHRKITPSLNYPIIRVQCRVYDEMMRCGDQSPLCAACSAQIWRPQPSLSEVRGRLVCSTAALQRCSVTPDWRQALDTILAVFLAAVSHDAPFRCWNYSVSSVHNLLSLNSPILSITQQSHTLLVREYFKP